MIRRAAVLIALACPACLVRGAPEHVAVETPPEHRFAENPPVVAPTPTWAEILQDPALDALVEEALRGNLDLDAATARVLESRALVGVARADLFPQVDAEISVTRERRSEAFLGSDQAPLNRYAAALPVSWELDIWGHVRWADRAARSRWLATEEARADVQRVLVADVAQAWVELRALDDALRISRETVEGRERTLNLFQKRQEKGTGSGVEVARAQADRAEAASTAHDLERRIAQKEHQISLLLGRDPGPVLRDDVGETTRPVPSVPSGLPSEILRRRPDVREAEQALAAAGADVGVARADLFPRLSLTGALGLESRELSNWIDGSAAAWSVGGSLFGPVFDGGRRRSEVCAAEARWMEARADYEQSVRTSLREVADALVAARSLRDVRREDEAQVAALREATELATTRYEGDIAGYLDVLDAQRDLFPARLRLASTIRDQWIAVVQLLRALGGPWR